MIEIYFLNRARPRWSGAHEHDPSKPWLGFEFVGDADAGLAFDALDAV